MQRILRVRRTTARVLDDYAILIILCAVCFTTGMIVATSLLAIMVTPIH